MQPSIRVKLNRTPLYHAHLTAGAQMVEFAGWAMPIQYTGILDEHKAVRSGCGLFDVSHMGRLEFSGTDAAVFLQKCVVSDVAGLPNGRAKYTLICLEDGGILDDVIVYNRGDGRYFMVCNAGNRRKVVEWLRNQMSGLHVHMADTTEVTVMLALQGPEAAKQLAGIITDFPLERVNPFDCFEAVIDGVPALVSRTGYTGEDGFELIVEAAQGEKLWDQLTASGVKPCGLGARDTLRLEAALLLHGKDMGPDINPYGAGLGWVVDLDKGEFVARKCLVEAKEVGVSKRLVGLEMVDRAIPRSGYAVFSYGREVGSVTSGGFSPTLGKGIGLGYVPPRVAKVGTEIEVDIRGTMAPAHVVRRPFYKRK